VVSERGRGEMIETRKGEEVGGRKREKWAEE